MSIVKHAYRQTYRPAPPLPQWLRFVLRWL